MKSFMKRVSSLALLLLLISSLCVGALAAQPTITFQGMEKGFGFAPGSEYTDTDLFSGFKGVMPGDVLTEEIVFTNSAEDCDFVQLYMRAEAHDEQSNPLSDTVAETETVATMTEFLSMLSMKVWNGTELIFDASADQLDGLKDNVLLGTFRTGESARLKVELTVPATLDNRFASRVGEVDWVFHVDCYQESQLTVRKLWSDGNANHTGDSISVNLLKDGKVEKTVELNSENGWVYTFDRLVEGYDWTVEEAKVPEGYQVSYETKGNTVTIINTKDVPPPAPEEPVDLTVRKVWSNDKGKDRPTSVTVTLYDGQKAYETVRLSDDNQWTYTWKGLSAAGNWQVLETNIPKGYTPSYSVSEDVVTITNTWKLIQTGQLNWPILVLGVLGAAFVLLGGTMLTKKKQGHA